MISASVLWIPFTLLAAAGQTARNAMQRGLTPQLGALGATLVSQAQAAGAASSIITGDRDSFQLVDDDVTVLYPRKGVSDLARMTPEAVEEKYGLQPSQYPDYAALRGDPSDNLPGIPGVGEEVARVLAAHFGNLDALLGADLDRTPDELQASLGEPDLSPQAAAGLFVAALREAFEESGVLFALEADALQ